MHSKIFWFDTETTGLDPHKNAMIQLGAIVEINGQIKEELMFLFKPYPEAEIDDRALQVNNRSKKEIMGFPDCTIALQGLKKKLSKYVNKYNKNDKFICAGFNVGFDIGFLRRTFERCGDNYFGSWFFNAPLDVWTVVSMAILKLGLRLPNYKLVTICDYFNIPILSEHNAIDDIRGTRDLFYFLERELIGLNNGTTNQANREQVKQEGG